MIVFNFKSLEIYLLLIYPQRIWLRGRLGLVIKETQEIRHREAPYCSTGCCEVTHVASELLFSKGNFKTRDLKWPVRRPRGHRRPPLESSFSIP